MNSLIVACEPCGMNRPPSSDLFPRDGETNATTVALRSVRAERRAPRGPPMNAAGRGRPAPSPGLTGAGPRSRTGRRARASGRRDEPPDRHRLGEDLPEHLLDVPEVRRGEMLVQRGGARPLLD